MWSTGQDEDETHSIARKLKILLPILLEGGEAQNNSRAARRVHFVSYCVEDPGPTDILEHILKNEQIQFVGY